MGTEGRRACVLKPAELPMLLERVEGKIDLLINGGETKRPARKRKEVMIVESEGLDLSSPDYLRKKNWIKLE